MLKVILEGHDNFYGLADIVRLFYGPCREDRENGCLVCDQGPDETIVINADPSTELPLNRQVKRDLYVRLKDLSGMSFPWGSEACVPDRKARVTDRTGGIRQA